MPNLTRALNEYISSNTQANLKEFIFQSLPSFASHGFETEEALRTKLKGKFAEMYQKCYPDSEMPATNYKQSFWTNLFYYNKKTPPSVRSMIFKWYYLLFEGKNDDFYEQNKQVIEQFLESKTSHPKTLFDKMSIKMLKDFNHLKNNDRNVLKLSMSYIVSTLNGDDEVYRKYIDNDFFWEIVNKCVYQPLNYVTEEEKAEIKKVCNSIIKEAKRSISSGVVAVLKEQLKLAEEEKRDSLVYQALQAMSYLLNGFEVWPKTAKESEAQKVSRINDLINIFFKDCSLNTKIGETIGDATKHACVFNESNFSSNSASASASALSALSASAISSSNSGRKIDLIVKDDKCFELAFCEFKAENKKTTTNHQQGKTLRLNLTILEEMKKLFVDEQVISFVWTGPFGAFFSLQESQDIFVARFAEPFIVPIELVQLDEDVCDTFVTLLNWKRHLLSISEKVRVAKSKPVRREAEYPNVCFTVCNQKRRKRSD